MQTQRRSFITKRPRGLTGSTRTCIATVPKQTGVDVIRSRAADIKAVAAAVVAEEATKEEEVIKAARVEAEGGIITKGTTSKDINRGTISKTINMVIITTTTKEGAIIKDLPRNKVRTKAVEDITILPRGMSRWPMGIILATLSKVIRGLMGIAHLDIKGIAGAMVAGSEAGETPSLKAPWTF